MAEQVLVVESILNVQRPERGEDDGGDEEVDGDICFDDDLLVQSRSWRRNQNHAFCGLVEGVDEQDAAKDVGHAQFVRALKQHRAAQSLVVAVPLHRDVRILLQRQTQIVGDLEQREQQRH